MTNIVDKRLKRLHIEHPLGRVDKFVAELYIRNRGKARKRRDKEIHEKLQPLFKALFMTTNPIPIKAALELSGWNVGNPRSPLSPLTMDMKEQLKLILKSLH